MRGRGFVTALAGATAAAGYVRYVRPWQLTWGATPDEVSRRLPGDELVTRPTFDATRAITVHAPAAEIWPWLVQVGLTRAGWYSYDILDNLGRPSARRILPELQGLAVGDVVPMSPDGKQGMRVRSLDPPHSMVWWSPEDTTWTWQLDGQPDGSTRLITRVRARYRWLSPSIAFSLLVEFGDIWMMRKMLRNLRTRAEGAPPGAGVDSGPDGDDDALRVETLRMAAGAAVLGLVVYAWPRQAARLFGFPSAHVNDSTLAVARLYAIREAARSVQLVHEVRTRRRPRPATLAWNLGIDATDAVTFTVLAARGAQTRRATVSIALFAASISTLWLRLFRRVRSAERADR